MISCLWFGTVRQSKDLVCTSQAHISNLSLNAVRGAAEKSVKGAFVSVKCISHCLVWFIGQHSAYRVHTLKEVLCIPLSGHSCHFILTFRKWHRLKYWGNTLLQRVVKSMALKNILYISTTWKSKTTNLNGYFLSVKNWT